jgi:dipeptidyl aminopeptidase/acylaminoacyl peptidase
VTNDMPRWEQRIRAAQLLSFSLLGPPVSWATDESNWGVLLSTLGGRAEVFAFDAGSVPAALTQITGRPQGTMGAAISPDASAVFWFDDSAGDEVGRWQRHDLQSGAEITLLPDEPPTYGAGIHPLPDGGAVIGRLLDEGFDVVAVGATGSGRVAYSFGEPAFLVDATADASLALVAFAPGGDWLHLGARVVRLSDGEVIAELAREGKNLEAVGFHPKDPSRVLLGHEPDDRVVPMVWDTATGVCQDVVTGLDGDVSAHWSPDGAALLLTALRHARHTLHRLDLGSGQVTAVPIPRGSVSVASPRPDGSVHALMSGADRPTSLVRVGTDGKVTDLVTLPGEAPPASVAAEDVFAEGPKGRVHGLLYRPLEGTAPYPTVFAIHGGPTAQDFDSWNDTIAAYVDLGYAVVRVNYRGSTGYGAAWRDALQRRVGFIELEDISAVRDALESAGIVDRDRVSIAGGSWGGYLTLMALGLQPERWRSGVALVPLADWFTATEDSPPFMKAYDRSLFGADIEEMPDAYRASSPITYADRVTAPVFITAGENDPRCPVRQVDLYVEALRTRGHDVRYDRLETGHAMPDLDMKVTEIRRVLEFLSETNPSQPRR